MKKLLFLLMITSVISCSKDKEDSETIIYNQWRWEQTTFDTRGAPITAEEEDTTYFYHFKKGGELEIKDVNKKVTDRFTFEILPADDFNSILIIELDEIWGYNIRKDSLTIWEPSSIFPRAMIFKVE